MRNADVFEINLIQDGGHVLCGVVYDSPYGIVHRKKVGGDLAAQLGEYVFLMETAENDTVVALHSSNLRAVTKGPSRTPKKSKRKPVKGTKPCTKIPYKFEDVEVGDTVVYTESDGTIVKYLVNEKTDEQWDAESGGASYLWKPSPEDNALIIKPYKELVKTQEEKVSAPEKSYRIGDRFELTDKRTGEVSQGMICQTGPGRIQLICMSGSSIGNRWNCGIDRSCMSGSIPKGDFQKLFDYNSYTYKKI